MTNKTLKDLIRNILPRQVKPYTIWGGLIQGAKIITSWHDYPSAILGYTERPLLEWFSKNVALGETWLDIGAHYGYTAIALSRLVGERGRVFAFEPMLSTVGYLAQTRRANRFSQLVVLPFGLADVSAVSLLRLPVTRGMVDSTLVNDSADLLETIHVVSLDRLWPSICEGEQRVQGVKIDVQGMEIEVLKGMVDILKTHQPRLVVEVHHGVDRNELLDILAAAGYSREADPVEPLDGEETARYIDNRSYAFHLIE